MRDLRFENLTLISLTERKAASFQFHPQMNLITGENHTGKSLIIKSIFWTLGAEPDTAHPAWKALNIISLLRLSIGGVEQLTFIRRGKTFYVFDAQQKCLLKTTRVTSDLGPFLAKKIGVSLRLASRQKEMVVPPPAYIFLPFYIDQEKGWGQIWSSFGSLNQFPDWKDDLIKFHTGQRTNDYYDVLSDIGSIKKELEQLNGELKFSRVAYDNHVSRSGVLPLAFDRQAYQASLQNLLRDLSSIQSQREKLTARLTECENERILLEKQIRVARAALLEAEKDYKYAAEIQDDNVICPTCGTSHENSFIQRYSLAETVEDYRVFLSDVEDRVSELRSKREAIEREVISLARKSDAINSSLNEKRGRLKVSDIIESEGHKRAREILRSQLDAYISEIEALEGRKAVLAKRLKALTDQERNKEITGVFFDSYSRILSQLEVLNLSTDDRKEIPTRISETGSEQPRAILGYSLAMIETLSRFSSTPVSAFVADTPLQQEQDRENSERILRLLASQKYTSGQVIVGTVSSFGIKFPGLNIHLTRRRQLLEAEAYPAAIGHLQEFRIEDLSTTSSSPDTP